MTRSATSASREAGRPLTELKRSAGVELSYDLAKQLGWVVSTPARGDLVCFQWDTGALDHIGFVVEPQADGSAQDRRGQHEPDARHGARAGRGRRRLREDRGRGTSAPRSSAFPATSPIPSRRRAIRDWAAWVKAGRKGKRPNVPEKVPADWWAKIGADAAREPRPDLAAPRAQAARDVALA